MVTKALRKYRRAVLDAAEIEGRYISGSLTYEQYQNKKEVEPKALANVMSAINEEKEQIIQRCLMEG